MVSPLHIVFTFKCLADVLYCTSAVVSFCSVVNHNVEAQRNDVCW